MWDACGGFKLCAVFVTAATAAAAVVCIISFFMTVDKMEELVDELVLVDRLANPAFSRSDTRYFSPSCDFFLSALFESAVMMRWRISFLRFKLRSISFCISCLNSAEKTGPCVPTVIYEINA